jgi:hypothetical protein
MSKYPNPKWTDAKHAVLLKAIEVAKKLGVKFKGTPERTEK